MATYNTGFAALAGASINARRSGGGSSPSSDEDPESKDSKKKLKVELLAYVKFMLKTFSWIGLFALCINIIFAAILYNPFFGIIVILSLGLLYSSLLL
jgi:hypothetical protein